MFLLSRRLAGLALLLSGVCWMNAQASSPAVKPVASTIAQADDHSPPQGLQAAAAVALQAGDLARAAALLEEGAGGPDVTPELLTTMADVYRRLGRLADAAVAAERALDLEPDFAPAHLQLGEIFQELGWHETAADSYRLALAADPQAPAARYLLVKCLADAGRLRAAEDEARSFLAQDETARLCLVLGEVLQRQRRGQEALAAYDRAVEIEPRLADAHARRASLLYQLGQYEEAVRAGRAALEIDANHPEAHRWLSLANIARQDYLAAYGHALRAEQSGLDMSAVWAQLRRPR